MLYCEKKLLTSLIFTIYLKPAASFAFSSKNYIWQKQFSSDCGQILHFQRKTQLHALTEYLENDIVSVKRGENGKLHVVRPDGTVSPLCAHEDDNPTDLYVDPRLDYYIDINDSDIVKCYGEGWYSQRVVPSLGGGPGYGAEADDVWSIEEDMLEKIEMDKVEIPLLDLGIAHGEKARGGAI